MEIHLRDSGKLVELPIKPDWGPGKIMKIEGGYAYILFRDSGDRMLKKYQLGSNPLRWSALSSDSILDAAGSTPKKKVRKIAHASRHLSFGEALNFFLERYPGKFDGPSYRDNPGEGGRLSVENAAEALQSAFGEGQLKRMVGKKDLRAVLDRLLPVLQGQDLLGRDELAGFKEVLREEARALRYLGLLSDLLEDPLVRHDTLNPYFEFVRECPVKGFAKWPNATLLPFLIQPGRHMFLRPKTVRGFAALMGHDLMYEPQPNWRTYRSLLEASVDYLDKLEPLGATDLIDVQNFFATVLEESTQKQKV